MNKTDLSTPAQKWRMVVFVLLILTFASTLIPGTYVYCAYHPVFHPNNTNHAYYNYINNPFSLATFCAVVNVLISAILTFKSLKMKDNRMLLWVVLFCSIALFWIRLSSGMTYVRQCYEYGHGLKWLPFVPPILLVLSMITAVIAWFVGRKKA